MGNPADRAVPNDKIQPLQSGGDASNMAKTAVDSQVGGKEFAAMQAKRDNPMSLPNLSLLASEEGMGGDQVVKDNPSGQLAAIKAEAPESVYKNLDASMAKMNARTDDQKASLSAPELQAVQGLEKSILTGKDDPANDKQWQQLTDQNTTNAAGHKVGENEAMEQTAVADLTSIGVPAQVDRFNDERVKNFGEVTATAPPSSKAELVGSERAEVAVPNKD